MELYRISVPKDTAWHVVRKMSESKFAHFINLNSNAKVFELPYHQRIKLCDETERRLNFLLNMSREYGIDVKRPDQFFNQQNAIKQMCNEKQKSEELLFDTLEQEITQKEKFVQEQHKLIADMQVNINKQVDYAQVLTYVAKEANNISAAQQTGLGDGEMAQPLLLENMDNKVSFVAGCIKAGEEESRMSRMLFRITKGKALCKFGEAFDSQDGTQKVVYLIVFEGGRMLTDRINKICDSFMGSRFQIGSLGDQLFADLTGCVDQVKQDHELLKNSKSSLRQYLESINGQVNDRASQLEFMHNFVIQEK